MSEMKPRKADGLMKCSSGECPHYRKSGWEQHTPSTCEIDGGAGYTPQNICVAWYVEAVKNVLEACDSETRYTALEGKIRELLKPLKLED